MNGLPEQARKIPSPPADQPSGFFWVPDGRSYRQGSSRIGKHAGPQVASFGRPFEFPRWTAPSSRHGVVHGKSGKTGKGGHAHGRPIRGGYCRTGRAALRGTGDFRVSIGLSTPNHTLREYAIDPCQQFAYTSGKNASDIALVIDAMDLLHSRRFDGFCLVSSDSDFTRLASRLREEGADVYGFGAQKTPESFRQACRRFIYTENLLPESTASAKEQGGVARRPLQPAGDAVPLLMRAMEQIETEDGWVGLGVVGQRLANITSDFDPRTFGYRKLSDLVRDTGAFEIDQSEGGRSVRVRARPAEPARQGGRRAHPRGQS